MGSKGKQKTDRRKSTVNLYCTACKMTTKHHLDIVCFEQKGDKEYLSKLGYCLFCHAVNEESKLVTKGTKVKPVIEKAIKAVLAD
jgi:hypothetical protein